VPSVTKEHMASSSIVCACHGAVIKIPKMI